jgi:hypothetical protein
MSLIARRSGAAALVCVVAALTLVLPAPAAQAAAYRYWGYYTWTDGAWTFAQTGPDQSEPADGSVEGWRFAVTTEAGSPRVPRADGDFDAICAGTAAAEGRKRVAVVVDAGLPSDAPEGATPPEPRGACASVPEAASGAEVLAAVATARVEGALVCAVDGYPETGCGEEVDIEPPAGPDPEVTLALPASAEQEDEAAAGNGAADEAAAEDDDGGTPWPGIAVAVIAVALLGGAAAWRLRSGSRS